MRVPFLKITLAILAMLVPAIPGHARITRVVVEKTESLGHDGYQKLTGRYYGEIDPRSPLNAIITDVEFAPRNSRGMVEYSGTFTILKPAEMSKSSGILLYIVANRGRVNLLANGLASDARRRGDVLVASGWQGDTIPAADVETMTVPVAKNPDGSSITGAVLARFNDMAANANTLPILRGGVAGTADPATLDTTKATLTRRLSEDAAVVPLRSDEWAFADCTKTAFPGTPEPRKVCLKNGFDPAYLYELVYTAKDPKVLGIGFAATRDLNSFLRYGAPDDAPLLDGRIKWAISQGSSQSGTMLRSLVGLGFNQDESGRIVFDGTNINIALRNMAMNIRFGEPSGAAAMYEAGSSGVEWWEDFPDDVHHRPAAGLLDRCRPSKTCPKIVETFGASEMYNYRGSSGLVGTAADRDIPLPSNVRRYFFPGVQHGGAMGNGFNSETRAMDCNNAGCMLPANPNPSSDNLRALQTDLVDWVVKGTEPPPSQYPRLDRGELVEDTAAAMGFPMIPGVPLPDGVINPFYDYDYGPKFHYADDSGVMTLQPPPIRGILPNLVPKVDADGNEPWGVPSVLHQVPLGTYAGWNIYATGFFKGHLRVNGGSFVSFAKTKSERIANGDPRPSLEERYGTHEKYVAMVRTAAAKAVHDRFLLQEDADRLIGQADASPVLK